MDSLIPVLLIFAGVVIGAVVAGLVLRAKAQRSYEDGKSDSATQVAALVVRGGDDGDEREVGGHASSLH